MGRNTSISLGNHFEYFIENSIQKEVENKLITLKNAIDEGTQSERALNFDAKSHLEELKRKKLSSKDSS